MNMIKKTIKNWMYDKWYLVVYSLKHLLSSIKEIYEEMKKPTFWFYVLVGLFIAFVYTKKYSIMYKILPVIFVIYILIQRKDGRYREEMFKNDLVKYKDSEIVTKRYERYSKEMEITRKVPKSFEEWKEEARVEIIKKPNQNV